MATVGNQLRKLSAGTRKVALGVAALATGLWSAYALALEVLTTGLARDLAARPDRVGIGLGFASLLRVVDKLRGGLGALAGWLAPLATAHRHLAARADTALVGRIAKAE